MKSGILIFLLLVAVCSTYGAKNKFVILKTNYGDIKFKLYEDTPQHTANFLRLVKEKHYDGMLFHRVIKDFMIQGGSSDSRNAKKGKLLGEGKMDYTIEAEILPAHSHKKGALCAARQGDEVNPKRRSSGEQFYIVQGQVYTEEQLERLEQQKLRTEKNKLGKRLFAPKMREYNEYLNSRQRVKADSLIQTINMEIEEEFESYKDHLIPAEAREAYKTIGGTPFLDGAYTVFGEVVEGFDVLDKISALETDSNDRPKEDVVILETKLSRK